MATLTKVPVDLEDRLDNEVNGGVDKMSDKDAVEVLKEEYKILMSSTLDYTTLYQEIEKYNVSLPEEPDVVDLSDINKRYALAQSALTRVSNIERQAIMNCGVWSKYRGRLQEYIDCKSSKLLINEDVMKLSNAALQKAEVRNRLSKTHALMSKIVSGVEEAESFKRVVENKKKDLASVITNLSRQVKVLSLESNLTR